MLTDYIIALTHLYGLVDKNKVIEIYNIQNENQIEGIDLGDLTGGNQQISSEELDKNFIQIHHKYFVHEKIMDFNEVEKYLKEKADKPYYIPDQEELLNYKDDFYFEVTKEYLDLLKYATDHLYQGNEREAEHLAEDIQGLCSVAATPSAIVAEIKNMNLSFKNDQQFDEFFQLIFDLANNTRLWEHNGHTANEIYQLTGDSDVMTYASKSFVERQVKIGRNDPCPCGSGKKYKKCCM